jgi:Kef-type K+ transport system membrane component KefB
MDLIGALVSILLLAALSGFVMSRLGQLPLVGYLLAGLVWGAVQSPGGLRGDTLAFLGELGIVLLLFYLGIELSWRQVAPIVGRSIALAIAAVGVPFVVLHGTLLLVGLTPAEALLAAFALSLTSTAIGVQVIESRNSLSGRLGQLVVAVNLVIDVGVVLVLAALGAGRGEHGVPFGLMLLRMAGFAAVMGSLGLLLIPRFLDLVHDHPVSRMILPVVLISVGIGVAVLGSRFNVPLSIGAFIAGSIAAEARCREDLRDLLHPVKELFIVFFFVGIGFQISPESMLRLLPAALLVCVLIFIVRSLAVSLGAYLLGEEARVAISLAAVLLPIGEFSFLVIAEARLPAGSRENLMALGSLVIFITAFLVEPGIRTAPAFGDWVYRRSPLSIRHLVYLVRGAVAPAVSPFPPAGNRLARAMRDLGFTAVAIVGLTVGITEAAAYFDSITPDWADIRLLGLLVSIALLAPAVYIGWLRWNRLLDAIVGPYKQGPGTERIRLVQRATHGALNWVGLLLMALAMIPILYTLAAEHRIAVLVVTLVFGLAMAWFFRKDVGTLHRLLEEGMGRRRPTGEKPGMRRQTPPEDGEPGSAAPAAAPQPSNDQTLRPR